MSAVAGHYGYWMTIVLMVAGMYIVIARGNLLKKLIGLAVLQTSVYLLYIGPAKLVGGTAPIVAEGYTVYSNPLPHVLILTAIVVGVATLVGRTKRDHHAPPFARRAAITPSTLNLPAPCAASTRKPPAMARFLKKLMNCIWSASWKWNRKALATENTARPSAAQRVSRPAATARPGRAVASGS